MGENCKAKADDVGFTGQAPKVQKKIEASTKEDPLGNTEIKG